MINTLLTVLAHLPLEELLELLELLIKLLLFLLQEVMSVLIVVVINIIIITHFFIRLIKLIRLFIDPILILTVIEIFIIYTLIIELRFVTKQRSVIMGLHKHTIITLIFSLILGFKQFFNFNYRVLFKQLFTTMQSNLFILYLELN